MSSPQFIHVNDLKPEARLDFDTIIWDLDGTLYPINQVKKRAIAAATRKPSIFYLAARFYWLEYRINRQRQSNQFKLNFEELEMVQPLINQHLTPDLVPKTVLSQMQSAAGKQQIVVSEYPIKDKLERLGLGQYIEAAYSCPVDFKCWKPNPVCAQKFLQKQGISPRFCVIGDRLDTDLIFYENLMSCFATGYF